MSEILSIGVETGCTALYANLPRIMSSDHDIEQGLYYIERGCTTWPGDGSPITEEVRNSYLAGHVVTFLGEMILDQKHYHRKQKPKLFNPYLKDTLETIDGLLPPESRTSESDAFAREIYYEWLDALDDSEDEQNPMPEATDRTAELIGTKSSELKDLFLLKVVSGRALFKARGTLRREAYDVEDLLARIEKVDMSEVPPSRIEVVDGELVEPSVHDLIDIVNKSGAQTFEHDFPFYSTWNDENGVPILAAILEDVKALRVVA